MVVKKEKEKEKKIKFFFSQFLIVPEKLLRGVTGVDESYRKAVY